MNFDNFDILKQISSMVSDFGSGDFIFIIKIFALTLTAVFGILLVIIYFKIIELFKSAPKKVAEPITAEAQRRLYDQEWSQIYSYLRSLNESEWKLAIIEGDKILDDALRSSGFPGETMGERLMSDQARQLYSLSGVWDAHKLRNFLVHDISVTITQPQAASAVAGFEAMLKELQLLS